MDDQEFKDRCIIAMLPFCAQQLKDGLANISQVPPDFDFVTEVAKDAVRYARAADKERWRRDG